MVSKVFPYVYSALLFGLIGLINFQTVDAQQYSTLAESFLVGRLDMISSPVSGWADTAQYNGRYYWPLGPLPAVIAMPLVSIGLYHQGTVSFVFSGAIFLLCLRLAKVSGYTTADSCWWAIAFCFGTSFIGVSAIAFSWYFAHVIAVLFLFLAIVEYEGRRRPVLVGSLIGLAMASRPLAALNILFFTLATALSADSLRKKTIDVFSLLASFAFFCALLAFYNFARFGNPMEFGYTYQVAFSGNPYETWTTEGNAPGPLFSMSNIPGNFAIFGFGLPDPRGLGTSVFIMSPFLVVLASVRNWDLVNKLIGLNILTVLMAVLTFRNVGFYQVGFRFSLDFLPFVFWLMMRSRIRLTRAFKALVILSTIIDAFLVGYFLVTASERGQFSPTP